VPDRPLQHLSATFKAGASEYLMAERAGFEPALRKAEAAFRERYHKPLGHLSPLVTVYYNIDLRKFEMIFRSEYSNFKRIVVCAIIYSLVFQ
jgi:hypothetical protein